jgi:hypothetical protein
MWTHCGVSWLRSRHVHRDDAATHLLEEITIKRLDQAFGFLHSANWSQGRDWSKKQFTWLEDFRREQGWA